MIISLSVLHNQTIKLETIEAEIKLLQCGRHPGLDPLDHHDRCYPVVYHSGSAGRHCRETWSRVDSHGHPVCDAGLEPYIYLGLHEVEGL